jgi:uncharacterized protein YdhG (YjbR/CyaY superfamily)
LIALFDAKRDNKRLSSFSQNNPQMETSVKFKTVDQYMRSVPEQALLRAEELRDIIRQAAPKAEEMISYNMPAYKLNGILVYFAAYKGHIGFYPAGKSGIDAFSDQLEGYKTSKGTIQFPLDKPIPRTLVRNIVKFRINENNEKAALKKAKK